MSPKHAGMWLGLPIAPGCEWVCDCESMVPCGIPSGVYSHLVDSVYRLGWIHQDPDQRKAVSEDEWLHEKS